ncbi:hypothetical protein [Desulfovibrio inopinatus]|uniref:hypothetical protein n=1 Tax=Desulfovibrio inopinatus TaxID=102109 RepID=UPI0004897EC9|nr:hypothetical protein [Desulfovibrio inopinatus]
MSHMRILIFLLFFSCALPVIPTLAAEQSTGAGAIPDITGVWTGTSDAVVVGKLAHTEESNIPKFLHVDFTLTIDKQDGRAFHGSKSSSKAKEQLVGVIDETTMDLYMADEDGVFIGSLRDQDTMIVKYLEPGKASKVAGITIFSRKESKPKQ